MTDNNGGTRTSARARKQEHPAFEEALERLEEIVDQLDDGNLPLEKSLALFKEGTRLAKVCRDLLARAEVAVKEALAQAPADEYQPAVVEYEEAIEEEDGA